ncbi:hypothetical protein PENSTE_c001G07425 [Penicillium steckii]|uniref:Uncharacterized protein n=1 Tax=Penicillium steckii TaxID=303698 RepID=A0A1V6TZ69_9EURO|nr:hypothetical protein PENSTE_c001G07425 [Penicillium steckii]
MSSLEQARFLRALCRLYTLRNICGPIDRISKDWDEEVMKMGFDIHAKPDRIGVYRCFYGVIPRWEAQEMGCVYNYLFNRIQPIYEAVYNDYDAIFESGIAGFSGQDFDNDECIRFRMPLPVISYLLKEGILKAPPHPLEDSMLRQNRQNLTSFMVCWGPELIYRLLQAPRERRRVLVWNHLPSNFDKNDQLPRGLFVGITRIVPISVRLGHIYPADRHERRSDFRQFWSTLPAIEQPSEGFKSLCLNWEHFGLSHEYCMSTDGLATVEKYQCEWGFALWDRERLAQFGFPLKDNPNMIVRHPASPYRPPGFF